MMEFIILQLPKLILIAYHEIQKPTALPVNYALY